MSALQPSDQVFEHGYGWRKRIGMIVPGAVDETSSVQFYRMAPSGVTLVKTSLGEKDLTVDEVTSALGRIEGAAEALGRRGVDCVLVGGSPTVVVKGVEWGAQVAEIAEKASGVPSSTAQQAAIDAMRHLGLQSIAVATPFNDEFNEMLRRYLEDSGFTVVAMGHLGVEYKNLMSIPLEAGYRLGVECFKKAQGADGMYFPGAPFPIVDVIDRLENELSTVVVTSLQAQLWRGLQLGDRRGELEPIHGYGRLLRTIGSPGTS